MVTILRIVVDGKCIWCCQTTTEMVEARFLDGLQGLFCKKDFWAALKARSDGVSPISVETAKAVRPT